jgi:hypothetical protein
MIALARSRPKDLFRSSPASITAGILCFKESAAASQLRDPLSRITSPQPGHDVSARLATILDATLGITSSNPPFGDPRRAAPASSDRTFVFRRCPPVVCRTAIRVRAHLSTFTICARCAKDPPEGGSSRCLRSLAPHGASFRSSPKAPTSFDIDDGFRLHLLGEGFRFRRLSP